MPAIRVNDIDMYYEEHGSGEPLILITGLGGIGASWGPQIPLFAEKYHTIVPDHRGAGHTTKAITGYTISENARDMAELLHALGATPAHIVGSSTGSAIGMVMALEHPDTVRSLTLTSAWGATDPYFKRLFELRKQILQQLGQQAFVEYTSLLLYSPSILHSYWDIVQEYEQHAKVSPLNIPLQLARMDMVIAHNVLDRLSDIKVPCNIVVGELDIVTPPYFSEELKKHIPHAELHIIPNAGHSVYIEQAESYFRIVNSFLERILKSPLL